MQKKYHFISGLPRSGSTLLTGILRQNPKFHSNITDALINYFLSTVTINDPAARTTVTEEQVKNVINGIFDGFYKHIDREVIFNCNRHWTKHLEYLYRVNDNFRVICCVRDYNWILNSFEKIYKSRTLLDPINTTVYDNTHTLTVWHRTDFLATDSFVRASYNNLKEAYYGPYRKHLLLVEYNDLTKTPKETMKRIYDFIEEPYYEHDFNNVEYSNEVYDTALNATGLHTIRRKVEYDPGTQILPPDLWDKYSNWEFWR